MSQYWEAVALRSKYNTPEEFESAAYRLVSEQVLYHADRHSRIAYGLIESYEREFRQALEPLGVDIRVNSRLRYACALPKHAKGGVATTAQTLLALVLRRIYDESARVGQLNDAGEVMCDLIDLEEKYRITTSRDLPGKGELDGLLRSLKRWGIAAKIDSNTLGGDTDAPESQPYVIVIRPAIVDILGEAALDRLARWNNPAATRADDIENSNSVSEDEVPE